jgi:hypothetical protein
LPRDEPHKDKQARRGQQQARAELVNEVEACLLSLHKTLVTYSQAGKTEGVLSFFEGCPLLKEEVERRLFDKGRRHRT